MAPVTFRGVFSPDWIFIPQNEAQFYVELRSIVPQGMHARFIDDLVEKSTLSIRHKLTVMMYQAALISKLKPEEFVDFEEKDRYNAIPVQPAEVNHYGYSVMMRDIHEYRLYLALFLETFAATAFSLLDVTGHLLRDLYDIPNFTANNTTFSRILPEMQTKAIYPFLFQYAPGNPTSVPWIKPLKEIRNRTTHRPITDVCEVESIRRNSSYRPMSNPKGVFYLDPSIFNGTDVVLPDFMKQVFDGLEAFVEELYDKLQQTIVHTKSVKGSLPLD
jgi:hypothetical protein